jgi:hypothetical protein
LSSWRRPRRGRSGVCDILIGDRVRAPISARPRASGLHSRLRTAGRPNVQTLKPAVIGTQRCVDKGLVFIPRLLLAILAYPEGCGNLERKQNAMKLGIPLGRFSACYWMKGRVRHLGAVKRWCCTLPLIQPSIQHRRTKGLLMVKSWRWMNLAPILTGMIEPPYVNSSVKVKRGDSCQILASVSSILGSGRRTVFDMCRA